MAMYENDRRILKKLVLLYLGFFIIFSFSNDDDAFEEFRE
jgi:hypothetical protein